jgi:hypothetical protein
VTSIHRRTGHDAASGYNLAQRKAVHRFTPGRGDFLPTRLHDDVADHLARFGRAAWEASWAEQLFDLCVQERFPLTVSHHQQSMPSITAGVARLRRSTRCVVQLDLTRVGGHPR